MIAERMGGKGVAVITVRLVDKLIISSNFLVLFSSWITRQILVTVFHKVVYFVLILLSTGFLNPRVFNTGIHWVLSYIDLSFLVVFITDQLVHDFQ